MNIPASIDRYLYETLGMEQASAGKHAVDRAIKSLMNREKISGLEEFERLFGSSEVQRQKLIDEIVVGETWFFRDKGPFEYLALYAQELINAGGVLNILSAPCSTGEEAYSIVMTLLQAGLSPDAFSVDAADISAKSLKIARKAVYGKNAFREPSSENYAHYFLEAEKGRQVTDQVVRQVRFLHENLILPRFLEGCGPYHIIFCRNFLIYLTAEVRKRVFQQFNRLLMPGGVLFSGHSETVFWQQNGYIPIRRERSFALSKSNPVVPSGLAANVSGQKLPLTFHTCRTERRPSLNQREVVSLGAEKCSVDPVPISKEQERKMPETSIEPQLQAARRLADQGDLAQAIRLCQEYEKRLGPSAEVYYLTGLILEAGNDLQGAEGNFLKALYLEPGHYESLIHVSLLLQRKGDDKKASLYRERAERCRRESGGP
jgi:chemotaxis protein methyltransferase WspC